MFKKVGFPVTSVAIIGVIAVVFSHMVLAQPPHKRPPRLAYFTTGGNESQSLHMVFLLHRRQPPLARHSHDVQCSFSGALRTIDLNGGGTALPDERIVLGETSPALIITYDFEAPRSDIAVEVFGEAVPKRLCRITLHPTLISDDDSTTGPVRCCGEACDCPPRGPVTDYAINPR